MRSGWVIIITNLNFLYPMGLCAMIGTCSKETTYFYLLIIFSLEKSMVVYLNKLEFPYDALCQVCLKLLQWFCR